jgi:putative two-component system response regulator
LRWLGTSPSASCSRRPTGKYKEALELAVRERTHDLQRRSEELEEARLETLRRLALAAEYRDDHTFEHTERVGRTAALLAEQLGLAEREISLLRLAVPLHDIGKLGVSDTILLKPGKLTPRSSSR